LPALVIATVNGVLLPVGAFSCPHVQQVSIGSGGGGAVAIQVIQFPDVSSAVIPSLILGVQLTRVIAVHPAVILPLTAIGEVLVMVPLPLPPRVPLTVIKPLPRAEPAAALPERHFR